jgi:hypothetical protein
MGKAAAANPEAVQPEKRSSVGLILTEIYILLAEEVAPSIINRPIVPQLLP